VPYARDRSGILLYGDASTWWDQARGRYARGHGPLAGAVLVFRRSAGVPEGHIAVVRAVRNGREILIDHANWAGASGRKGRVAEAVPAVDFSPRNDWTVVQIGGFGRPHPTFGFIYP
jgi:surface antigen